MFREGVREWIVHLLRYLRFEIIETASHTRWRTFHVCSNDVRREAAADE